jgi:hypothetical protein
MLRPKQSVGIKWLSDLPLRFRFDNFEIDRAVKPIDVWKPVRRLRGGGLRTFLCDHDSCTGYATGKFSSQARPSSAWIVERFLYFRALRSPLLIAS